jgi:hypothetical protein
MLKGSARDLAITFDSQAQVARDLRMPEKKDAITGLLPTRRMGIVGQVPPEPEMSRRVCLND